MNVICTMAAHNDTGRLGEKLAMEYFMKLGYQILERNWRCRRHEVDLIAHKNGLLYFIEVKCRSGLNFGYPEESVSLKKIKNLIDASAEYIYLFPQWERIQFNVLSVILHENEATEFFLIEDVYL